MKLNQINNESWEDAGFKDPTKKPDVTNAGYLLGELLKNLNKDEWVLHNSNYIDAASAIRAEMLDRKTGIFYEIIVRPKI